MAGRSIEVIRAGQLVKPGRSGTTEDDAVAAVYCCTYTCTSTGGRTSLVVMADPFSSEAFYGSARDFALSALEAHHAGRNRRVPIDAGTALEHLAKACLAERSPALLAELKGDSGVNSVMGLLRIKGVAVPTAKIRTVGLTEALARAARFVRSKADKDDLQLLIDMRNGVVHAAVDTEVEERMLAAFIQQADALLNELGRNREDFWGGQIPVVDEFLKDASDKVKHRVDVRVAGAAAMLSSRYATEGQAVILALQAVSKLAPLADDQRHHKCPVCDSFGVATGTHDVAWEAGDWDKETGEVTNADASVWFSADSFRCPVCGLRLDSQAEIDACFDPVWEIEDADWRDYDPDNELPEDWRDYVELDEAPEDGDGREDADEP